MRAVHAVLTIALVLALAGCAAPSETPTATRAPTVASEAPAEGCPPVRQPAADVAFDQALHDELIAMLERDQAGRTGTGPDDEGDAARTERLREMLAEHGWPSFDLVGEDGEDAAWAIAQHSDLDPDFQRCALEHLRVAVDTGQGSPGNLAYLDDRINVAAGEQQRYGTQVGCTDDGPQPSTPLQDAAAIDEIRASVGLAPFEEYLAEIAEICAEFE